MSSPVADGDADPLAFARRIALTKLTARAHSESELRAVLAKKGVPAEVADELIGRLTDVGLVDDSDFADQWVRSRHEHRNASRTVLRRELRSKGVGDDEIDQALAGVDDESERAAAQQVADKKARSLQGLPREVAWRRLAGALARRGFSPGLVTEVVRSTLGSIDD